MNTFNYAIVRTPAPSIMHGLTSTTQFGIPNYEKSLQQHENYIRALEDCGVTVTVLPACNNFPDSCFVEDIALLTEKVAILTRPGAPTRQAEVSLINSTIRSFYKEENVKIICAPGTLEAGDVLRVNNHFYIGLSARTNRSGAEQLIDILNEYGYSGSVIELKHMLHLKTGVCFLKQNTFLVSGEFINAPEFCDMDCVIVDDDEDYAANCIMVNDTVLMPFGFPKIEQKIKNLNFKIKTIDTSEFRKVDGGLSCLSLRF